MNKLQMAHEFMMKKMETETIDNHWELFYSSWRYADAMQAEADKRVVKLPDVFFDTKLNEEWQIKCDELQGRIGEAMDYIAESGGVNLTSEMALNHILKGNKDEN